MRVAIQCNLLSKLNICFSIILVRLLTAIIYHFIVASVVFLFSCLAQKGNNYVRWQRSWLPMSSLAYFYQLIHWCSRSLSCTHTIMYSGSTPRLQISLWHISPLGSNGALQPIAHYPRASKPFQTWLTEFSRLWNIRLVKSGLAQPGKLC